MPVTNSNKKTVDLPFFEAMNLAPATNAATTAIATAEGGDARYVYYLANTTFYRYDTYTDGYQQLASPATAIVTSASMRYTKRRGYHGRVIAATSSNVQIGGLRGGVLGGNELEIVYGTGAGQKRTITLSTETTHDSGVATSAGSASLADSLKKWKPNQWAGYTVRITFGTGATVARRILYNDTTTLYINDTNLMPHDPWAGNVAGWTLAAQTNYVISSQTFTLNSNWTVTPDSTSYFTVKTGGIYLLSSAAAAPFFTFQYYDIANDVWIGKTVPQGLLLAALGTDFVIERTSSVTAAAVSTTGAISGGARTLTDAGLSMTNDRYANYRIEITGGTGVGQRRRIVGNTATVFTTNRPWDTQPNSTSTYEVRPDFDRVYMTGNANSAMFAYSPENDWWMQGHSFDDGVTNNISCLYGNWAPFGVSTGARIAAGITAVNSAPTAGGTNYVVGDILTCAVGGAGAQVIVTAVSPGGIVTAIELLHSGTTTGFTTGTGKATTGGTGTGCTIEITSVGATALITTVTNHFLKRNDSVTFAGCSEAAWNAAHTVLGVPSTTTFCVAVTATANMAASNSQSTTLVVDASKNWTVNEHVGRLVHVCVAGVTPTSQIRWITANTATTLTVATITAAVTGNSKYVIYDAKLFGVDTQRRPEAEQPYGYATSGTTTSLTDSSKNWVVNQWAGYLFKVEAGTGYGSGRISITSNTATTLNFSTQTFTPDTTTKYEIADTWGLATAGGTTTVTEATTKNWATSQWIGKRVRFSAGTSGGNEYAITASSGTVLTFGTGTAPDTTTAYAILGSAATGVGTGLIWAWGATDADKAGRYIFRIAGGASNRIDIFDVTTGRWNYGAFLSPQTITWTTNTSYTYDGANTIYFATCQTNTAPTRFYALDVRTGIFAPFGQTTQVGGTVHIGNFVEYIASPDGVPYLYYWHNAATAVSRAMIF